MAETPAIRRITLTDFRSYERLDLSLSGKPVVLSGANGSGKTNLLEALSMLSAGRGMRRARLGEIARQQGTGGWTVTAILSDGLDENRLGVGVEAGAPEKRVVRIDGSTASGPTTLLDYLGFQWLTPAQDRLFMEGAAERRRFLDRMILSHDPAHGKAAATYEKAMRQRTKLLEDLPNADQTLLGILERQMAEAGVAMAAARREMTARLAAGAQNLACDAFPAADLALEGTLEEALVLDTAGEVEEAYEERLKQARWRDAAAGRALEGAHRSDLLVTHRDKQQAARLCSTGEQKALLIGLVLANATATSTGQSRVPLILLLDEVAAHLDAGRRAALFDILHETGMQAFMTGTDAELFEAWGARAEHYEVQDSCLSVL
ncbi:MAG: DNA replication/repair protein RecF [Aquisalinus sp.]|nr:DNA replication/repair protein RecF [Aquisalinus sp.]